MMRHLGLALLSSTAACFDGEGSLGGACERDADCGGAQSCERSICSLCGDGVAQAGELCLDEPEPTNASAEGIVSLASIDMDGDGQLDLVWPGQGALSVARVSEAGIDAAQALVLDVTAVWSGDIDGDGVVELLTRDSATGAALWRANGSGELVPVPEVDVAPLRGLSAAVLDPDFGVIAEVGSRLVRVQSGAEPIDVELDADATHLVVAPSIDEGGRRDVVVVLEERELVGVRVTDDGMLQPFAPQFMAPAVRDVAAVRWNGDAYGDVVILSKDGEARVWLSDGTQAFVEGPTRGMSQTAQRVLVHDMTDDLVPDVFTVGPESNVRLAVQRGGELDRSAALLSMQASWATVMRVGTDPFDDLVLYDGTTFFVARGNP